MGFPNMCGRCDARAGAGWLHSLPCMSVSAGGGR